MEAERLHIRATLGFENTLGSTDPNTLKATDNLARTFLLLRKLPEAESLYLRLLRSKLKLYGQNDVRTLATLITLATVLEDGGKIKIAGDFYKCAIVGYAFTLGPSNERVGKVYAALLDLVCNDKTMKLDAERFYRKVQTLPENSPPPDYLPALLERLTSHKS